MIRDCYACSSDSPIHGNCKVYNYCVGNSTNEVLKNMM